MSHKCPNCGDTLKCVTSKKNNKSYWICQGAEDKCGKIFSDKNGEPVLLMFGEPADDMPCPLCAAPMRLIKGGKSGDFWSCTKYPDCRGTADVLPPGIEAPVCPVDDEHGVMRLRTGKRGKFWSCSHYPDCTATSEVEKKK